MAKETSDDSGDRAIADSTCGVIFLGTPHKGSRFAVLGALLSLFSYWQGSRAELLVHLSPDSKDIEELHHLFLGAYGSAFIYNFFENQHMAIFNIPLFQVRFGDLCDTWAGLVMIVDL